MKSTKQNIFCIVATVTGFRRWELVQIFVNFVKHVNPRTETAPSKNKLYVTLSVTVKHDTELTIDF